MAREWLEREDLAVFVVAGVPKSWGKELRNFLQKKHGDDAEAMRLDDDLSEWVLTRVRGEGRASSKRSPASKALWRAFRALSAARYHLRGSKRTDKKIRRLREEVESLWFEHSPLHAEAPGD